MSDEEKLRVEAAKRLERRRKKMENASTRLALITGQPESTIKLNDSYTIDSPASTREENDEKKCPCKVKRHMM